MAKRFIYAILLIGIASAISFTHLRNVVTNPDGVGYYTHLNSMVNDHDLTYSDDFAQYALSPYFDEPSPTGLVQNQWPVGQSILHLPAYSISRLFITDDGAKPSDSDMLMIVATGLFFAIFSMLLIVCVVKIDYGGATAIFSAIAVFAGTPYLYYTFHEGTMAHSYSAFAAVCYFALSHRAVRDQTPVAWLAAGAAGGIMVTIRTESALLLTLPIALVFDAARPLALRKAVAGYALHTIAAILCATPQMLIFWAINGSPFNSFQGYENLRFNNSHFYEFMFSTYHGVATWSPIAIAAFCGWILLAMRRSILGLYSITVFLLMCFVSSCMIWWWGGGAFGPRLLTVLFPLFVIGICALLASPLRVPAIIVSAACALWSYALYVLTADGTLWVMKYYTLQEIMNAAVAHLHSLSQTMAFIARPDYTGVSALSAVAACIAAASLAFAVIFAAPKIKPAHALCLMAAIVLASDMLILISWRNSIMTKDARAAEIAATARYTLRELYEPFPLEYLMYYEKSGRRYAEEREFARLGKVFPDNPAVHVAQAVMYMQSGNPALAAQHIDRASSMHITHPATFTMLMRVKSQLGASGQPR